MPQEKRKTEARRQLICHLVEAQRAALILENQPVVRSVALALLLSECAAADRTPNSPL